MNPYTFFYAKQTLDFIDPAYELFCSHRISPWSKKTFANGLQNRFSIVICEQSSLVGYLIVSNVLDEAEIEDICIAPKYRQRGIASLLIDQLSQNMLGAEIDHLLLEVAKTNENAIGLYTKKGFEQVGVRKNYYSMAGNTEKSIGMKKVDAILMKRSINPNYQKNNTDT